jgi:ribosomal protein S18 acetylase RimI-like enzyme
VVSRQSNASNHSPTQEDYQFSQKEAIMPLVIRRADPADADLVVDFNRRLAEESEGKKLDTALLAAGVAQALSDSQKGLYFLASESGRVIGQMMITTEWSDWRNGWFWWIQSVYVRAEARRQGVFRSLFEHVHEAARQDSSVIGLRLYVDRGNHIAQETYRRMGMTDTEYFVLEKYPL